MQTCSALCNDAILHANTIGIKTVFTEHSLFGFADLGAIVTNKFLEFTLTNVNHVICVSHTRYYIHELMYYVINMLYQPW